MTKKRLVLVFPGFEKTSPHSQLDRMRHCARKTGEIWKFEHERTAIDETGGAHAMAAHSVTRGGNWQAETRAVLFSWQDIIEDYEGAPHPQGFLVNMPKFLAFFVDGTVSRYWKASRRYFGFTIFPVLLLVLFFLLSVGLSWFAAGLFSTGWLRAGLAALAGLAAMLVLSKWPGERLYLLLTINDWGFARDVVNRSNAKIEARYREFASRLASEIRNSKHDEIIISGHSFGSVWAVAALATALAEEPELLKGRNVTFLALGSSLLKIALAPGAQFLRDWTKRVLAEPTLFWHEIQTKHDFIAFYKANPFETLAIADHAAGLKIDRVDFKRSMARKRFRKMRRSFYETHRQYILYQDVRVPWDYMLRLFGPLDAKALALSADAPTAIDGEGKLV